jgi:hypothetical protein
LTLPGEDPPEDTLRYGEGPAPAAEPLPEGPPAEDLWGSLKALWIGELAPPALPAEDPVWPLG